MMLETLGGLPAHPLVVHLPVVLVPLAMIGAVILAVRPRFVRHYGVLVAVLAGLGFLGSLLAASTGSELEETFIDAGETISGTLRDHAEMGETVQVLVGIFFGLTLVWVLFAWWRRRAGEERATATVRKPRLIGILLSVLAVVAGVVATVSVYETGHSGAKSVWEKTAP